MSLTSNREEAPQSRARCAHPPSTGATPISLGRPGLRQRHAMRRPSRRGSVRRRSSTLGRWGHDDRRRPGPLDQRRCSSHPRTRGRPRARCSGPTRPRSFAIVSSTRHSSKPVASFQRSRIPRARIEVRRFRSHRSAGSHRCPSASTMYSAVPLLVMEPGSAILCRCQPRRSIIHLALDLRSLLQSRVTAQRRRRHARQPPQTRGARNG